MPRFAWAVGDFRKQAPLLFILFLAAAIRIWALPSRHEIRDGDEIGYVSGGLVAWEGMLPGWRAVPAGPQTWTGWLWIATRSAWDYVKQPSGTPIVLKPFAAIDQALFDTYADPGPLRQLILWISIGIALAGVAAAYRLGFHYGFEAGGILIGGIAALLPIYVEFAGISKSCSDSWLLGIAAISCAATLARPKASWVPGILLGLAISSRIDMVLLAPIVIWALWDNLGAKELLPITLRIAFVSALTLFVAAPWLMIGFVGSLRTSAMARVVGYWNVESPRLTTFKALTWAQGLGPLLLATVAGFCLIPPADRLRRWALGGFTLLMVSTMFVGHYQVMRYHGGPLIAILTAAAVATGAILNRFQRWPALAIAVCLLILPMVQSVRTAMHQHSLSHDDRSTEWIEKHVPAGTIIYFHATFACETILPTVEAADAIWKQVADEHAWRTKLEEGFRRFSLSGEQYPRAMSEDNLCMDRAICRRWFILGGGSQARPRYDVRPFDLSATFGLHGNQIGAEFKRTGGVLIWRTASTEILPDGLGEPIVSWVNSAGNGTLVFVSNDVRASLSN